MSVNQWVGWTSPDAEVPGSDWREPEGGSWPIAGTPAKLRGTARSDRKKPMPARNFLRASERIDQGSSSRLQEDGAGLTPFRGRQGGLQAWRSPATAPGTGIRFTTSTDSPTLPTWED